MPAATDFDLLILGGGCAGLSLAQHLAESDYRGRVGIVEPRRVYRDDRSWCFWAPDDEPPAGVPVSRRWQSWRFARMNHGVLDCSATGYSYHYVNSLDFYRRAVDAISARPNMSLLLGEAVEALEPHTGRLQVQTTSHRLRADQVVDTRPPGSARLADAVLQQCFVGRVVQLRADSPGRFDPAAVELMTDMRNDRHGLQFSYVLPFSRQQALVEVTRFAPVAVAAAQLDQELDQLLERRGWQVARVERSEAGSLPMGLAPPASRPAPGVVRAGTGGGALRAASGYGFQRIQSWARACCDSLGRGGPALAQRADSARQRYMDGLFLQVLKDQPQLAPELFEQMASAVPGPVFVRFMSDRGGWLDSLRVIASLPRRPFLGSLVRKTGRSAARLAAP